MTVKAFNSVWHGIHSSVATQYATGLGHSSEQNTHPTLMEFMAQLEEREIDQSDIYQLYRSYYYYPYSIIQMELAFYSDLPQGNPNQDFHFFPSQLIQHHSVKPTAVIYHSNDCTSEREKEHH